MLHTNWQEQSFYFFFTLKWEANLGWLNYETQQDSDSLNCLIYHPTSNYAKDSKVSAWSHLSQLNPLLLDYLRTQSISRHGNRCNWHLGRGSVRVGEHVIHGHVQPSKQTWQPPDGSSSCIFSPHHTHHKWMIHELPSTFSLYNHSRRKTAVSNHWHDATSPPRISLGTACSLPRGCYQSHFSE